jgi:hypothetical protein
MDPQISPMPAALVGLEAEHHRHCEMSGALAQAVARPNMACHGDIVPLICNDSQDVDTASYEQGW